MKRIKRLSTHLSNKIAAGEVVERPSSVVKELVENAIDAGSHRIQVEIEDGGKKLIKITDDGQGIHPDDIDLIFERHATSKIQTDDDLYQIKSLGFRGEALASIAAVSKVELQSKTPQEELGFALQIYGGNMLNLDHRNLQQGTSIRVRDLFYNTPARHKFLSASSTELKRINQLMANLAIGNPSLAITYMVDSQVIFQTSGRNDMLNVIYEVHGKDLASHLIQFDLVHEGFSLSGYLSDLMYHRGNKSLQSFFVNNRYIVSKSLQEAFNAAYKALIPIHRFPVCFLHLDIPYDQVDVNIHPAKTEIRINGEEALHDQLTKSIRKALYGKDIVSKPKAKDMGFSRPVEKVDHVEELPPQKEVVKAAPPAIEEEKIDFEFTKDFFADFRREAVKEEEVRESKEVFEQVAINSTEMDGQVVSVYDNLSYVGQIFNSYLLYEKDYKLYFIDQHAAHEKILYEEFMITFERGALEKQGLLLPLTKKLGFMDMATFESLQEVFTSLGFEIEQFGKESVIIRSIPTLFTTRQAEDFFSAIMDDFDKAKSVSSYLEEEVISHACKKAIKSYDKLASMEAKKLVEQLKGLQDPMTCPHGRPIIMELSEKEIQKLFKRI